MKHHYDCEVIQDLIPGYIDKILSKTGMKVVEEHLEDCERCREVYRKMQEGNEAELFSGEREALDGFRKVRRYIRIKGIIGVCVGLCLAVLLYILCIHYVVGLPSDPHMIDFQNIVYHEADQSLTIEGALNYSGFRVSRVNMKRDDDRRKIYITVYEAESLPFYQGKKDFSITIPQMEDYTVYVESSNSRREIYQWQRDFDHAVLLDSLKEKLYASVSELDREREILAYSEIKELEGRKGALYSVDHLIGEDAWYREYLDELVIYGDIRVGDFELWISLEEPYQILVYDIQSKEYTQDTSVILDYKKIVENEEF